MQTALMLLVMLIIICFSKTILASILKFDPVESEKYPIKYPIDPVDKNYADVINEINNCTNEIDMKRAYVRIIIFQGCYPKGEIYASQLWTEYFIKEVSLNVFS